MDRRTALRALALSTAGLAGCGGDGRFIRGGTQQPLTDRLEAVAAPTQSDGVWQITVTVRNTGSDLVVAEFGARVVLPDGTTFAATPVERAIRSGVTGRVTLDVVALDTLGYDERVALLYEGFELVPLLNGEPFPAACPDSPAVTSTETGCLFERVDRTYVTVEYAGAWGGSVNLGTYAYPVNRSADGAPPDRNVSYLDLPDDPEFVAVSIRKSADGRGELTVRLHHDGAVVANDTVTDPVLVAQVAANLTQGGTAGPTATPADTPADGEGSNTTT